MCFADVPISSMYGLYQLGFCSLYEGADWQFVMCAGKIILEAAILTAVVVVSLTAYTFWAAKRGHDFNFLGPFLFAAIMVLMVFSLIQVGWLYFDSH